MAKRFSLEKAMHTVVDYALLGALTLSTLTMIVECLSPLTVLFYGILACTLGAPAALFALLCGAAFAAPAILVSTGLGLQCGAALGVVRSGIAYLRAEEEYFIEESIATAPRPSLLKATEQHSAKRLKEFYHSVTGTPSR